MNTDPVSLAEILLYETADGQLRIETRFTGDTAWLSLTQMAELFQRDKSVISRHVKNIFGEGELDSASTVAKYATVQLEGDRQVTREIEFYSLDVVINVGYRVKSHRGTQFRNWATQRLGEYIVKGFTLDDQLLKRAGGGSYFDELLERIRDIRSSEKVFWRKVLEIYATSIDYDPVAPDSKQLFATVQHKMHWAAHGLTAAEVVIQRADASDPNMGMTSWAGDRPLKTDASIAKNYLSADELEAFNRIVTAYLEFAELQALNRNPMYMATWISKLDDFLRLSGREVLAHAGAASHLEAVEKAHKEYEKYRVAEAAKQSRVEIHFEESIKRLPAKHPGERRVK
jgi:hypothetical protein